MVLDLGESNWKMWISFQFQACRCSARKTASSGSMDPRPSGQAERGLSLRTALVPSWAGVGVAHKSGPQRQSRVSTYALFSRRKGISLVPSCRLGAHSTDSTDPSCESRCQVRSLHLQDKETKHERAELFGRGGMGAPLPPPRVSTSTARGSVLCPQIPGGAQLLC